MDSNNVSHGTPAGAHASSASARNSDKKDAFGCPPSTSARSTGTANCARSCSCRPGGSAAYVRIAPGSENSRSCMAKNRRMPSYSACRTCAQPMRKRHLPLQSANLRQQTMPRAHLWMGNNCTAFRRRPRTLARRRASSANRIRLGAIAPAPPLGAAPVGFR